MRLCVEKRRQLDIQGGFVNLRFAQKVAACEVPCILLTGLAQRATVAQSEPQVGAVISAAVTDTAENMCNKALSDFSQHADES